MKGWECDMLCGDSNGCYRGDMSSSTGEDDENAPKDRCTLVFARAWPEPQMLSQWSGLSSGLALGTSIRTGMVWTTDSKADNIWYYTADDGGQLSADTRASAIDSAKMRALADSPPQDLHLMWKFDTNTQTWQAMPSSLTVRPRSRSGATTWVDDTGSLFLFNGLASPWDYSSKRVVPFDSQMDDGNPFAHGQPMEDAVAELWRFDTERSEWQLVHMPTSSDATSTSWPQVRRGATTWRASSSGASIDQTSVQKTWKIWMFGGVASGGGQHMDRVHMVTEEDENSDVGSELWQYTYGYQHHAESKDLKGKEPSPSNGLDATKGEWTLVTASPGVVYDSEPVYRCAESGAMLGGRHIWRDCPAARTGAGSWASPNGAAGGYLFGGLGRPVDTELNDLWHWNGDLSHPKWTEVAQPPAASVATGNVAWPPAWQNPRGWASDADGGELWISGDAGEAVGVFGLPVAFPSPSEPGGTSQNGMGTSSKLWRFSISTETWETLELSRDDGGEGHWPAARQSASIGTGVMFGGIEPAAHDQDPSSTTECLNTVAGASGGATGPTMMDNSRG